MKIGQILHAWRTAANMDLKDLSRRMGVSAPTLMRLERGKQISERTMSKVMAWLTAQTGGL